MKTNETTISAAEIYQEFLKLNDAQKDKIINSLVVEGVENESVEALRFLAVLSNKGFRDRVLKELYAEESFKRLKREAKMNDIYYFGRNIEHDEKGYYLVYQNKQSVEHNSKNYSSTLRLDSWDKARKYLSDLIEAGHTWLPVQQDPTI